jgi:hypothetical protein
MNQRPARLLLGEMFAPAIAAKLRFLPVEEEPRPAHPGAQQLADRRAPAPPVTEAWLLNMPEAKELPSRHGSARPPTP